MNAEPTPMLDRTRLEGLRVDASIGVYPFEHEIKQTLVIDVTVHSDLQAAADSDALAHAVDYDRIAKICRTAATEQHHQLIETVAGKIAHRVLADLPMARMVDVRIAKPGAVPDADNVAVELRRTRGTP